MEGVPYRPPPLSGSGDLTKNWQEWKTNFINYVTVNNYIKQSEDFQIFMLKETIGPLGIYFINLVTKDYNENELNSLQNLLDKLDIVFKVPLSEVRARYNFFTCSRGEDENINKYIDRLKEKAKSCKFGHLTDSLIRDKVITNIKDKGLLLKLFEIESLDLIMLCQTFQDYEICMKNNKKKADKAEMTKNDDKAKNADKSDKAEKDFKRNINKEKARINNNTDGTDINKTVSPTGQMKPINFTRNCWRCNQKHPIRCCPAFGSKCEKCGERNHMTSCCRMRISNNAEKKPPFEIPSNPRETHNSSLNIPSNKSPSAPPAFQVENTLYPNLNYPQSSGTQIPNSKSFQPQSSGIVTESLKKSVPPMPKVKKSCDNKNYAKATPVEDNVCKML